MYDDSQSCAVFRENLVRQDGDKTTETVSLLTVSFALKLHRYLAAMLLYRNITRTLHLNELSPLFERDSSQASFAHLGRLIGIW